MKKIKLNKLIVAAFLVCLISITGLNNAVSDVNTIKGFKGKVVFQDDKSPVTGGIIEVFLYSDDDDNQEIVESVSINSAGEFTLYNINGIQSDRIKIMCYPNDLDNFNSGFERTEIKFSEYKDSKSNGYDIIFEVKRLDKRDKLD